MNQMETTIGSLGRTIGAGDLSFDRPPEYGESVDPAELTLW